MSKLIIAIALSILTLTCFAKTPLKPKQDCKKAKLIFVFTAHSSDITSLPNHQYLLKLKKPSKMVTYFASGKCRNNGIILMKDFISGWNKGRDSFVKNPPNASIEALPFSLPHENYDLALNSTFKLTNPKLSKETLEFTLTPIDKNAANLQNKDFGDTALFIDSYFYGGY